MSIRSSSTTRFGVVAAAFAIILSACSGSTGNSPAAATGGAAATAAATTPTSAPGTVAAGSPAAGAASKAPCGTVNLAKNEWVGFEANLAVVSYLLKNQLGCKVTQKTLKEEIGWQGLKDGTIDAILENWGHEPLVKKYITDEKIAQDAGLTGNEGLIAWFVPKYFADANPDILTAATNPAILNQFADQFKTSESHGKGQLLDGDPSFVTNDQAIVDGLGLNYQVVYSGSEAASNKAIKAAADAKKPILAYYYEPNWFSQIVPMTHVPLPAYTPGCDTADPKKIKCDYPPYHLNKIISTKFAESGSPAVQLIKNFKWTNDDQNSVATSIAQDKMSDDDAAKKWLDAHPDIWKAWLAQ